MPTLYNSPLTLTTEKKTNFSSNNYLEATRIHNQASPSFNRRHYTTSDIESNTGGNNVITPAIGCGGMLSKKKYEKQVPGCVFNIHKNGWIYKEKLKKPPWRNTFKNDLNEIEIAWEREIKIQEQLLREENGDVFDVDSWIDKYTTEVPCPLTPFKTRTEKLNFHKANFIIQKLKKKSISHCLDIESMEQLWESVCEIDCDFSDEMSMRQNKANIQRRIAAGHFLFVDEKKKESKEIMRWLQCLSYFGLGYKYFICCEKPGDFRLLKSTGQEAQTRQFIENGFVNNQNVYLFKKTVVALRKYISYKIFTDQNISTICADPYELYSQPKFKEKPINPADLFNQLITSTFSNKDEFSFNTQPINVSEIYKEIQSATGTEEFDNIFRTSSSCNDCYAYCSSEEVNTSNCCLDEPVIHILEMVYTLIIMGIFLTLPIMDLIDFVEHKESMSSLIEMFFDFIPFFQYVFGTCYFRTPQFRYFLRKKYEERFFSNLKIKMPTILICFSIFGFLLYGITFAFVFRTSSFKMIVGTLYGGFSAPIIVNNAIVFNIIFQDQYKNFNKIAQQIRIGHAMNFEKEHRNNKCCNTVSSICCPSNPKIKSNQKNPLPLEINDLLISINESRYNLEKNMRAFNQIYVSCATTGFVGSILLIATMINRFKRNTPISLEDELHIIIISSIWCILFAVFTYRALSINISRYKLIDYLRTPFYTHVYLSRHKLQNEGHPFNTIKTEKNDWLLSNELVTSLEWRILTDVLNSEWYEFNLFGFNIVPQLARIGASVVVSSIVALLATI